MSARNFGGARRGREDYPFIIDSDDSGDDYSDDSDGEGLGFSNGRMGFQRQFEMTGARSNGSRPVATHPRPAASRQPSNIQARDSVRRPDSVEEVTSSSQRSPARMRGATSTPKRQKKSAEDDLICPLSLELPIDPVMAMDNRVYERSLIEKHFQGKPVAQLKSPITGQKMGKTLRPAIQHRNTIETLIEIGTIGGGIAETWKKGVQEMKLRAELVEKAEKGNVDAMLKVANNYHEGENGFAETSRQLLSGDGVPQDEPNGLVNLGIAAGKGSDLATFALGLYYADGDHGLPRDKDKAIDLLQDSLSDKCLHCCMNADAKRNAKEKLDKLLYGSDDDIGEEDDDIHMHLELDNDFIDEGELENDFVDEGDY